MPAASDPKQIQSDQQSFLNKGTTSGLVPASCLILSQKARRSLSFEECVNNLGDSKFQLSSMEHMMIGDQVYRDRVLQMEIDMVQEMGKKVVEKV